MEVHRVRIAKDVLMPRKYVRKPLRTKDYPQGKLTGDRRDRVIARMQKEISYYKGRETFLMNVIGQWKKRWRQEHEFSPITSPYTPYTSTLPRH